MKALCVTVTLVLLLAGCASTEHAKLERYNAARNHEYTYSLEDQRRYFFTPPEPAAAARSFARGANEALGAINSINACPAGFVPSNTLIEGVVGGRITDVNGKVSYQFDADGRRTNRCVPGGGSEK